MGARERRPGGEGTDATHCGCVRGVCVGACGCPCVRSVRECLSVRAPLGLPGSRCGTWGSVAVGERGGVGVVCQVCRRAWVRP